VYCIIINTVLYADLKPRRFFERFAPHIFQKIFCINGL
jgi:hypothetical protein